MSPQLKWKLPDACVLTEIRCEDSYGDMVMTRTSKGFFHNEPQ